MMRQYISTGLPARTPWISIGGLLLVTSAAVGLAGLPGLVLGGVLTVGLLRLTPESTFALGQFALAVATPTQSLGLASHPSHLGLLILGELGLLGLLLTASGETQHQSHGYLASGVTAGIVVVGLGVGWWSVTAGPPLWLVAGGVLASGAGFVYLVQSYERWKLAQVPKQTGGNHE